MIRVFIVEDSPVVQEFLVHIFGSDPEISVIGLASNGEEAVAAAAEKKPDVITMDINMPKMNGIEATRKIMETNPVPIVIVSGNWNPEEVETTFKAMEAGAIAIVQRPMGIGHPEHQRTAKEMLDTVKLMSEVKVVRRRPHYRQKTEVVAAQKVLSRPERTTDVKVVAMGASTGGPVAIQTILRCLPKDFRVPILIVQHIAKGFLRGMVDWLSETSSVPVHLAVQGEKILPGHAYFAPEGLYMGVRNRREISLSEPGFVNNVRESVSFLFRSVSEEYGANAVGVLLTGMGKDGAEELKSMKKKGSVTIVQDKESSVIFGMPGVALELGAATYVLPPDKISETLAMLTNEKGV
jgi:two-component system chemotaxis response regulator CheB